MPGPYRANVRPVLATSWFSHNHSCSLLPDAEVFVDPNFVASELPGDPIWTRFAAQSVPAAPNVSASATTGRALYSPRFLQQVVDPSSFATSPASQGELFLLFGAGQFTPATSFSPTSGSNERGPIAPEYGALPYGVTT